METHPPGLLGALARRAPGYGISIRRAELPDDVPGIFDGLSITLNQEYDKTEQAFYLGHSIGSIAEWSLHFERSQQIFTDLRHAKREASSDEASFVRVLDAYLAFELRTWEFAIWLLHDLGHTSLTSAFSNFGRADMESMRIFHTTGKAPVWREFFAGWNDEVKRGERTVASFTPRAIPDFRARQIPKQEIVQEED